MNHRIFRVCARAPPYNPRSLRSHAARERSGVSARSNQVRAHTDVDSSVFFSTFGVMNDGIQILHVGRI